ncbi:helix-turn-helix transcriptional regulator [Mucilaginibacter corticis]|uniref:Helix-turn-helix transcriptional regulator n=1 Tax=Mucilaginibacter corticis TaxID=2597670 RepID=A0A556MM95_9SPHI|nr:helix-turn-helix transcriptional regulator [Mucilaginibacter corticis]TSJ40978.1 helix-turn-helix transcriptional regulator [Mucilaginibacter corticis]
MAAIEEKVNFLLVNIRNRRHDLGYSQEYMAFRLGISQNAYSKIEAGKASMNIKRFFDIAGVLLTTPESLIESGQQSENRVFSNKNNKAESLA